MSGGVDSSVSAALLKERGYDVSGVFMIFQKNELPKCHCERVEGERGNPEFCGSTKPEIAASLPAVAPRNDNDENKCCSQGAMERVRQVATKLNIPFYVMDFSTEFQKRVIDYFIREYKNGRTPNPCVVCNKFIKLGLLLDKAVATGFDYVATGHYIKKREARIKKQELRIIDNPQFSISRCCHSGRPSPRRSFAKAGPGIHGVNTDPRHPFTYKLYAAKDKTRDQSYFLYNLTQDKLAHLLFPLGNYLKSQVWQMAKERGLIIPKTESRGICFIKDNNVADFLAQVIKFKKGPIKDIKTQKVLGEHRSLQLYTIGQRQAIGVGGTGPYYVVKLDLVGSILWVTNNPKDSALFSDFLTATNVHWIYGQKPRLPLKCQARIRYGHKTASCVVNNNRGVYSVKFSKPQRAITRGQSIVFYGQRHEVLGGGIIENF